MNWFSALTAAHVVLTTSGYAGLIATNAWLLTLCRGRDAAILLAGVTAWRQLTRWFGPLLGIGILAGFALAMLMGMSLLATWLVATYVLVIVTMVTQATITVPWQRRAEAAIARGEPLSTRPLAIALVTFCLVYIAILSLMLIRP